jgi:hypothetical protein
VKIGICGYGRSGKDTAAEVLSRLLKLPYKAGTSYYARHLVFDRMKWKGFQYEDANACWNDRHNHRKLWADLIGEYNRDDPARLYRDCLEGQNFLTGIRWKNEFQACNAAGLVDFWIWIENRNVPRDATCQVTMDDCDFAIPNSRSLEEYLVRLEKLSRILKKEVVAERKAVIFRHTVQV